MLPFLSVELTWNPRGAFFYLHFPLFVLLFSLFLFLFLPCCGILFVAAVVAVVATSSSGVMVLFELTLIGATQGNRGCARSENPVYAQLAARALAQSLVP